MPPGEIISTHISLTGAAEAVQSVREYAKSLGVLSKEQGRAADTSKLMANELTTSVKAISAAAGAVKKLADSLIKLNSLMDKQAAAANKAAASQDKATESAKAQEAALAQLIKAVERASQVNFAMADSEAKLYPPTEAQTKALENQTRQLLLARDATLKAQKAQDNFVNRMAQNAPRLSKFSLYIAGGIAGVAYEAIHQYNNFNKLMTQTFSQANVAVSKQKVLTQDVMKIAQQTGRSYNDVADALYRVASATAYMNNGQGASVATLQSLTKTTAQLQVLGNLSSGAQADAAARIIGAVANTNMPEFAAAANNPAKQGQQIGAMVNAIVGSGDIRMADLISALGRGVLTSAKDVGLSMKDTGAFIDLLTTHGTTGATAGTYVAHALQLLTGSTTQNRQWQAAIGLSPGDLQEAMNKGGLASAAELLAQHMKVLAPTSNFSISTGLKTLTGQAAVEYMMKKAQLTPEQIKMWESGALAGDNLTKEQQKAANAIQAVEMTAMFGGGRQAIPLITLMQSIPQFKEIAASIQTHSNQATWNKDLALAQNAPANVQARTLRSAQATLINVGKTLTDVFNSILKVGVDILGFMNKFKGYWVEIGAVIASVLGTYVLRSGLKAAQSIQMGLGGYKYYAMKMAGKGGEIAADEHGWANRYANKYGLKYGSDRIKEDIAIKAADEQITAATALLEAAGSLETAATLAQEAFGKSALGNANFGMAQRLKGKPWRYGVNAIEDAVAEYGVFGAGTGGAPADAATRRILTSNQLLDIKNQAAEMAAFTLAQPNPKNQFRPKLETLIARNENMLLQGQILGEEGLNSVTQAAAAHFLTTPEGMAAFPAFTPQDKRMEQTMANMRNQMLTTGTIAGYEEHFPTYSVGGLLPQAQQAEKIAAEAEARKNARAYSGGGPLGWAGKMWGRGPKINPDGSTEVNIVEKSAANVAEKTAGKLGGVIEKIGGLAGGLMGPWGMAAMMLAPVAVPVISKLIGNILNEPSVSSVIKNAQKNVATTLSTPLTTAQAGAQNWTAQANAALARQDFGTYLQDTINANSMTGIAFTAGISGDMGTTALAIKNYRDLTQLGTSLRTDGNGNSYFYLKNPTTGKYQSYSQVRIDGSTYEANSFQFLPSDYAAYPSQYPGLYQAMLQPGFQQSLLPSKQYGGYFYSPQIQGAFNAISADIPYMGSPGSTIAQRIAGMNNINTYIQELVQSGMNPNDAYNFVLNNNRPGPVKGASGSVDWSATSLARGPLGAFNPNLKIYGNAFTSLANLDVAKLPGISGEFAAAQVQGDTLGQQKLLGQVVLDMTNEQAQATTMRQKADAAAAANNGVVAAQYSRAANRLQNGADAFAKTADQLKSQMSPDAVSQATFATAIGQAVASAMQDAGFGNQIVTALQNENKTLSSLLPGSSNQHKP